MKYTKFESAFTYNQLVQKLSGLTAMAGYSYTKLRNPTEFHNFIQLLPQGYATNRLDDIESLDLIYSASTDGQYLLTLAVGRNDTFHGAEKFDIDVFNIAPNTGATASYFSQQWQHFKDEAGERVSYDIHPYKLTEEDRKATTYATFLTASTVYRTMEEYERDKCQFFQLHLSSFGKL